MPGAVLFVGRPRNGKHTEKEEVAEVVTPDPIDDLIEEAIDEEGYEAMSVRELKAETQERGLGKLSEKGNWQAKDADGKTVSSKASLIALLEADDNSDE